MKKKWANRLFLSIYVASTLILLKTFQDFNSTAYLVAVLSPQILCMLIYWVEVSSFKPKLKEQRTTLALNVVLYSLYSLVISSTTYSMGGVARILTNGAIFKKGIIQMITEQSPFISMVIMIFLLATIQYSVGKFLSKVPSTEVIE